jgi:cobalt-precorrin 5A hydrolase
VRLGLIYFTSNGEVLSHKLLHLSGAEFLIFDKKKAAIKEFVQTNFSFCDGLVFVCAAGIAVRLIAPFLKAKDTDPAVVVIDEHGTFAVPVLSGHLGGANELTYAICEQIGAIPVITTATDINRKFAVDVWSKISGCVIGNISKIKSISSAILSGGKVGIVSDFEMFGTLPEQVIQDTTLKTGICVSLSETKNPFEITLNAIPKIVTIGVGCRKNTDTTAFESYLLETLKKGDISIKSVIGLSSIDLKKSERCILKFCEKYDIPFHTYSAQELASVPGDFTVSEFVKKTTGVGNICERSALYRNSGELLVKKQSKDGMTVAVACKKWRCIF